MMRDSKIPPYTLSHDEDDLPTYTHETILTNNIWDKDRIVGIIDENLDHKKYLNKFLFKEVDVDSRYWVADGQLGGHYRIYDGQNSYTLEYTFKLTVEQAEIIVNSPHNLLAICSPSGAMYFLGKSMSIQDLKGLIHYKKKIDNLPNPPKLWKVG